ncbi:MAG: hypothetical protein Q7P63_05970 [Verrucomicrobiota bacterium JB022]|nr:hypothetical protein [Verrucomicrobiota bacterium JB022]
MKRFHFSLQALITLRQQALDQAMQAFGQATQRHEAAFRAVEQARQQQQDASRALLELRNHGGVPVGMHRQGLAGLQARQETLRQAERERMQRAQELEKARQAYLAAKREMEVVEKLKERHYERFLQEQAHAEEVEREDMVQMLYLRQQQLAGGDAR